MDLLVLVVVSLLVFAVAFVYSNLGLGGGTLYVPILLTFVTPLKEVAVPMSLAFTLATALPATLNHYRKDLVHTRLALILVGGALVGAVLGALFTLGTSREVFLLFFSVILVVVGGKMLRDWLGHAETIERDDDSKMTGPRLGLSSTATLSSGFLSGSLGIGGGVANVPIMVYGLGRRTRLAIGTSTLMIVPTSIVGVLSYLYLEGLATLDVGLTAFLWVLVLVGSYLGSYWGLRRLRSRSVALVFILVLFVAAVKLLSDLILGS
ncbi:MAG: sulfite exporter TauE/SafE family protein [Thermoplasmata archaeon]|nr:sulfite exporter TauE/SafE family protein [Thermoplasmata archaeon]